MDLKLTCGGDVAVQRPREQAVDSEIFANLADAGMSMAKKLTHGGQVCTCDGLHQI